MLTEPDRERSVRRVLADDYDLLAVNLRFDYWQNIRMAARLHPDFGLLLYLSNINVCGLRQLDGEPCSSNLRSALGQPDYAELAFTDFADEYVRAYSGFRLRHT